jgi:hypothetical protein
MLWRSNNSELEYCGVLKKKSLWKSSSSKRIKPKTHQNSTNIAKVRFEWANNLDLVLALR